MDKNIDAIKYEGVVTLKLIDEKTKIVRKQFNIHNEGSRNLFYFLCRCLAKSYDESMTPLAIDASKNTLGNENEVFNSSLSYRVLLSSQQVIKDFNVVVGDKQISYDYVTRFSAIIPSSVVVGGTDQGTSLKCFALYSKLSQYDTTGSLLAWINIEEGVFFNAGEALLVEWNLGFTNPVQI